MAIAMHRRLANASKSRSAYRAPDMPPIDQPASHPAPSYTFADHLRPVAHMGYEGARHLIPERLPSARRERTVGFRVIDLNRSIVGSIQSVAESLRRLDLSNLRLEAVDPDMIAGLTRLERIVLNHNRIDEDSFPENFGQLDSLVELSAHDNRLTQLPKIIRTLRSLHRLKLSENLLTNLDGIDKLKRLHILVVDDNRLEFLPKELFSHLKKLEYLHCARNALIAIPSDIRNLRILKDINISHNKLVSLPAEIFVLPQIEVINASGNQINRLPTVSVKGTLKRKLTSIDLSDNLLIRFPSHLLFMTNKLDLCENRIRTIPLSLIDKLDQVPELELQMDDNPMTLPPQDVCECGLRSIVQYFMEIKTVMTIHQGVKVLVLGAANQGKTSLVQTLADQQARATDDDRTTGVDIYEHSISLERNDDPLGRRLDLSLWDFSGNPRYLFQHQYFIQPNALVLLVFDMAEYSEAHFRSCFGAWIDWIIFRMNKIVAIPVGTHADQLRPDKVKDVGDRVIRQINKYVRDIRQSAEREIRRIDSKAYISAALSDQLEMYRNLIRMEAFVCDRVIPVSSTNYTGIEELEDSIIEMVNDKEVFPNVLREIPSLWGEVVNFIDDKGYAMEIPVMTWDDYVSLVTGKFGMRHLIQAITEFMHDTGKVLWFGEHPTLKDYVFLRPSWIVDVLKAIFRHDLEQLDYALEESFRQYSISQAKFERLVNEAVEEASFDRELIKCLWYNVVPTDLNRPLSEVLSMLLEHFEIGYATATHPSRSTSAVSSTTREHAGEKTPQNVLDPSQLSPTPTSGKGSVTPSVGERYDTPSAASRSRLGDKAVADERKNPPRISKILIPWLLKPEQPAKFKDEYKLYGGNASVAAVFRFPKYIPPGLFEKFAIRALNADYGLQKLYHWKNGLYARHTQNGVRFYLQRIDHDDGSTCISVETRHETPQTDDNREKQVEQFWQTLLPFLKDCEEVLLKYAGARMERYMECPYCRGLSFLGEWLTPKELQNVESKTCDNCNRDVLTAFLVQPKEKKRVEEYLLKRLLEEADKRRLAVEEFTNNDISPKPADNDDVFKSNSPGSIRPDSSASPQCDNSALKRPNSRGVERKRSVNGDRQTISTGNRGSGRKSVHHVDRSSAAKLRSHSNRSNEGSLQEDHIMMTLME